MMFIFDQHDSQLRVYVMRALIPKKQKRNKSIKLSDIYAFLRCVTNIPLALNIPMAESQYFLIKISEYEQRGYLLDGHINYQTGFIPSRAPEISMPATHVLWDHLAKNLPTLIAEYRLKDVVRTLPILCATSRDFDDRYLSRASVVISALAH